MDLHAGETVVFDGHPSWRSTMGFYLKGLALVLVVGAIVFVAVDEVAGGVAAFVLFDTVVLLGLLKRAATRYVITTERLHIRRGILSRATQETRIERVQNVNTQQSILERLLQVGTVDFDTAGTDDSEFRFTGVADPEDVVRAVDRAQREGSAGTPAPTA
ncbi:PH domain-containing protein [Conexibacter sp. SYSU D00693]|uniref:PH domain-containing protein n=1 Tax=Conexibacter sp. SYSU D00693 TaxID=2812560 RepID=UPI00196B0768|nr:PH domain-containing protein [Conexibacter sp. SYSU D00693]